jgi:hypothetical protein
MDDLTNILQDDELNEDQLKKYLSGNISEEERRELEDQIKDSDFTNDAVEGLRSFSSTTRLDEYVEHLNKDLHQYLASKKEIKEKRKIKDLSWIIFAVVIILLLCILAYVVIRMQREKQLEKKSISVELLQEKNKNNHPFIL